MSGFKVRLFDKPRDFQATFNRGIFLRFNVTETSLRVGWLNTKRHQPAVGSQRHGAGNGRSESLFVFDQVVSSQHQHLGIGAVRGFELKCRCCNGRRCITAEGFKNETLSMLGRIDCAVLIFSLEQEFAVGHRQNFHHTFQTRSTKERFLD
ncbi:hypothetical protein D3C81_1834540 [compost metagenome]